jgi:hypothetical protein
MQGASYLEGVLDGVFGTVCHESPPARSTPGCYGLLPACSAGCVRNRYRRGWCRGVADRYRRVPRVESQIAAGEVGAKALRIRSNGTLYFISPNAIPVLLGCDNVDHSEKSQGLPS